MIPFVEWLSSAVAAVALRVRGVSRTLRMKAAKMKADRVRRLMSKDSLTKEQAKELESLIEKLPEVTVDRSARRS